jgi:putative oxidoreductase
MTARIEWIVGRTLLAILFLAGAVQKAMEPDRVQMLLSGDGLPEWLVWPALAFNALAAVLLVAGKALRTLGLALAAYCLVTSLFHFIPSDPWQISIMIKNWAIAGGCLILASAAHRA